MKKFLSPPQYYIMCGGGGMAFFAREGGGNLLVLVPMFWDCLADKCRAQCSYVADPYFLISPNELCSKCNPTTTRCGACMGRGWAKSFCVSVNPCASTTRVAPKIPVVLHLPSASPAHHAAIASTDARVSSHWQHIFFFLLMKHCASLAQGM